MKSTYHIPAVLVLAGCAMTSNLPAPNTPTTKVSEVIRAFEEICLKTAPTFSLPDVANAAAAFGIVSQPDDGFFRKMGVDKDQTIGFIIEENKECAINTTSQSSATLTKEFLQTVRRHSDKSTPWDVSPRVVAIGGAVFRVQHDRRFGESFSMVRLVKKH